VSVTWQAFILASAGSSAGAAGWQAANNMDAKTRIATNTDTFLDIFLFSSE
jgi:hypothetical protein